MIARRRELRRELERAEREAARRDRLARSLTVIDDELRAHAAPWIDEIAFETRCRARWEEMEGGDAVRRCGRCHRDVHDLSQMTQPEIEALFARAAENPCVRLRRRRDDRVVTADCPVEPPGVVAHVSRAIAAGTLFGAGALSAATLMTTSTLGGAVAPPAVAAPLSAPPRAPAVDIAALRSSDEDDTRTSAAPVASPPEPPIARRALDQHIRWIAPQAWEIDRALIDGAASRADAFATTRLIPREEGLRVYGVRRQSILGRLGIQNGDLLLDVNGHPLTSLERVMRAYTALRTERAFFVRIERRGEERLHVYRITP